VKVTANDIAQLLAVASPRQVPEHVLRAAYGGMRAWFPFWFGIFFTVIGLVIGKELLPWRLWEDWRLKSAAAQTTPGFIRGITKTNVSGVSEFVFRYTPADGQQRQGSCFAENEQWTNNEQVRVRYLSTDVTIACVEGAHRSKGTWTGLFYMLFPVFGAVFVYGAIKQRRESNWLLREGCVTKVEVISVNETTERENYETVYRIVITGSALQEGRPVTVKRVKKADFSLALKRAREKQPVFILYDPRNPGRVMFPEALIEA
jgi:hypothetical protein